MKLAFMIGLRYTGADKTSSGQNSQLVTFLSRISVTGLVVGIALLITVLSVMNGFDKELRERILGLLPQAAIYHRGGIDDWRTLVKQLQDGRDVIAAAPFVQLNGLVYFKKATAPILLYGIDPTAEQRVSLLGDYVPQAALNALTDASPSIFLGARIAEQLVLQLGDKVMLVIPSDDAKKIPKLAYFTLSAIVDTQTEIDHSLAVIGLHQASQLSEQPGTVTGVRLKFADLFDAPSLVYQKLMTLEGPYYGSNWTHTHGNLYQAIRMSKNMVGLLVSLIVAIAVFNVVSTLVMVVIEKRGDIAILRTLGMSSRNIMTIFVVQGTMIGIVGILLGIVLGVLLTLNAQGFVSLLESVFGIQFLKSDVYPTSYLPTQLLMSDILRVTGTALMMSVLAALYPAWRASRVAPAVALRYE